jgi:hypothetical protein
MAQAAVAADPMNPALSVTVSSAQMMLQSANEALNKVGLSSMNVGREQQAAQATEFRDEESAKYAMMAADEESRLQSSIQSQGIPEYDGLSVNQGANYSMWQGGAAAKMNNNSDSESDSDSENKTSQIGSARPRRKRAMRKMRKNY